MARSFRTTTLLSLAFVAASLTACDTKSQENTSAAGGDGAASIPKDVFLSQRPQKVAMLREVKASSQVGDEIVFEARVGGRMKPFVDGMAIFLTADPRLISCDQRPGDHCAYPYDYCCEDGDALKAGTATVQIVNAEGTPYPVTAQGQGGIDVLKTLVIEGTVREKDANGVFVVDTSNIWVGTVPAGPPSSDDDDGTGQG